MDRVDVLCYGVSFSDDQETQDDEYVCSWLESDPSNDERYREYKDHRAYLLDYSYPRFVTLYSLGVDSILLCDSGDEVDDHENRENRELLLRDL